MIKEGILFKILSHREHTVEEEKEEKRNRSPNDCCDSDRRIS